MSRLEGKIAVVTSGGSGIGRAAALLLAREGAKVAVVGRRGGPLEETAHAIWEKGGAALAVRADLSRPADVGRVLRRVEQQMGVLQVLFNNPGTFAPGSVEKTPVRLWDRILDIDLKSVYLTSRAAIPKMRRRGGSIINNASTLGLVAMPNAAAYCAAKGASSS